MSKWLLFFAIPCFAQYVGTSVKIIPPNTSLTGSLTQYELRANGTNSINFNPADSIASSIFLTWPATNSPGANYAMCWDGTSAPATWCAATAAGAFVNLTSNQTGILGNKEWKGEQVVGTIGARGIKSYVTGGGTASAITLWNDSGGIDRVHIEDGGTLSSNVGIVRVNTNAGVFVAELSALGVDTDRDIMTSGVSRIDSSGNGTFANVAASGSLTVTGAASAASGTFTSLIGSTLNLSGLLTGNTANFSGMITVLGCSGCAPANYVTTNTNQTGMIGDKNWTGVETVGTLGAARVQTQLTTGGTASAITRWYDAGNVVRVQIEEGGSTTSNVGLVRINNNSGSFIAEMSHLGFDTSVGYSMNGTPGIDLTCPAGNYLFEPTFKKGILTAGTCAP